MIQIRSGTLTDQAFVYSTLLKGLYFGCELYGQIDRIAFFDNYSKVADRILGSSELRVACLADDTDVVLGYALVQDNVLHYCFVKKPWRKQGIAKSLCAGVDTVTHLTRVGQSIKNRKALTYNPFLI